jgi:hypothetical protein
MPQNKSNSSVLQARRGRYKRTRRHIVAITSFRRAEGAIPQTHESGRQAICRLLRDFDVDVASFSLNYKCGNSKASCNSDFRDFFVRLFFRSTSGTSNLDRFRDLKRSIDGEGSSWELAISIASTIVKNRLKEFTIIPRRTVRSAVRLCIQNRGPSYDKKECAELYKAR